MRRGISAILSFAMISLFIVALVGCGATSRPTNEKLKTENTSIKSDNIN